MLATASVDLYVAAQASHWFDETRAVGEARRILRGERWAALLWNTRRIKRSSFLEELEALLQRFAHGQRMDLDGLRGLLASTSDAPRAGHPDHEAMLRDLERLFAATGKEGAVRVVYETELYFGPIAAH